MELDWLDPAALPGHGVVSLSECLERGLTRSEVSRLVERGLLMKLLPRIYRTAGAPESFQQSLWAAHKWAEGSALFSHRTALKLRDWPVPPGRFVDMSTMSRAKSPAEWLNLFVTRRDPFEGSVSIGALPATGPGRSLLDAASVLTSIRLEMALDHALRRGGVTVADLWATLIDEGGRGCAGARRLKKLLEARDDGRARSHSDLEVLLDRLLAGSSLPPYDRQFEVVTREGIPAHIDFAWPEGRLGVESEGFDVHMRRLQWQSDMARQNSLAQVGWLLLRFSWYDVTRRPQYVLETIATTLAARLHAA
jgi:very-short-patch-repair endonuclease